MVSLVNEEFKSSRVRDGVLCILADHGYRPAIVILPRSGRTCFCLPLMCRPRSCHQRFSSTYTGWMPLNLARSRQLQLRAEHLLPGGVDSPVRAFRAVGGDPPFVARAEGAYLFDADGNRYLDFFGSWGPMILGHAFPPVVEAIQQAAARGASFGASTAAESDLAELVRQCFPSVEKLRFVSSGTEACMSAIRLARGFTGRKFVVKFEGCYHGHSDAMLVKAGSGVATLGIPGRQAYRKRRRCIRLRFLSTTWKLCGRHSPRALMKLPV